MDEEDLAAREPAGDEISAVLVADGDGAAACTIEVGARTTCEGEESANQIEQELDMGSSARGVDSSTFASGY